MAARHGRVDCSAETAVAVCDCGFVGAPHARKASAMADLEAHRRRMHPAQARDAQKKRRRRELIET
ncbi:hypothetical protein [Cellulomonas sp. URHB0016]